MSRLQVQILEEGLHVGGLLVLHLLHLVQPLQRCVEARVEDGVRAEHQLDPRLEGELVQAEVAQEGDQAELDDVFDLGVREDEDLVGRALDRVVTQQVFQQFQSNLRLELLLEHLIEDEIEYGEHGRHFLIAILVLLAEHVVHIVEVELEQFDFAGGFVGRHVDDRLEVEDLGEDAALASIRTCFLKTLCLILVQLSVEEESLLGIGGSRRNAIGFCSLLLWLLKLACGLAAKARRLRTTHVIHLIRLMMIFHILD